MTAETERLVESIVQEVVRRLAPLASPPVAVNEAAGGIPGRSRQPASTLRLGESLVTLATLEGRLAGVQCVEVARRAVVTPAVIDALRERRILLERVDPRPLDTVTATMTVVAVTPGIDKQTWQQALRHHAAVGDWRDATDLPSALRQTASLVRHGQAERVVLITAEPFAAACGANRFAGVRAAYVLGTVCVEQAVKTLAPNVLVLLGRRKTPAESVAMVDRWHQLASDENGPAWLPSVTRDAGGTR